MILFDNSLVKLDYNPTTDILEVAYPDLQEYLLADVKISFDNLVENIMSYDVKRVLLDSSQTIVSVSTEKSREITTHLVAGLSKTRLQKLARLQSSSPFVESTADGNIRHVKATLSLPFDFQNFTSRAEAVEWLLATH